MKNVDVLCLTVVLSFIKTASYAQVLIRGPSFTQSNPLVLYGTPEINDNLQSNILEDNERKIQRYVSPNRSPDEIFQGQFDLETINDVSNSNYNSLSSESSHVEDKALKDTVFMIEGDFGIPYLTSNSPNSKNSRALQTRSPHKIQGSSGGGCGQNCGQKHSSAGKTSTKKYSKNSGGHGSSKHQVKKGFARVCNGGGNKGEHKGEHNGEHNGGHNGGNKGGGGKQVRKTKKHSSTKFKVHCDCEKPHNGNKKHGHKHQGVVVKHQHKGYHHQEKPHQGKVIHHHKAQQHHQDYCKIGKDNKRNCDKGSHHLKKPKAVRKKKHHSGNSKKKFHVEGCDSKSSHCNGGFVRVNYGPKHGSKGYKQMGGGGHYDYQSGGGKGFIIGGCDSNSGSCGGRHGGFERFDYTEVPGGGGETYKPGKHSGKGGGGEVYYNDYTEFPGGGGKTYKPGKQSGNGGGGEVYYNDYTEFPGGGVKTYKPGKQSGKGGGGGEVYYNDYIKVPGGGGRDATYDYSSEGGDGYSINTAPEGVPEEGGSSDYNYDQTEYSDSEEEMQEGDYDEEEQDSLPGFGGGVLIDDSLTGFSGFFNGYSRSGGPGMKPLNVVPQALTPTSSYGARLDIQFIELCWKTSTLCLPDETVLYEGSDLSMIKKCVQKVATSSIRSSNNKGCDIVTLPMPQGSSMSSDGGIAYMTQQVLQKINQIKQNIGKIQNTVGCSDECCGI